MPREKMAGANLREGMMEVAFEQWIERTDEGKEQYNLYCMTYNDGDKDDKQINIDEFIEQYTY